MKKTAIREGVTYQTKNGSAARRVIKITNDPSEILDGDPSWTEGWVIYEQVRGAAKGMVRELTLPSFAAWAHSEEATVAAGRGVEMTPRLKFLWGYAAGCWTMLLLYLASVALR